MIFMEAVGPSITIIKERSGEKNKEANFLLCDGKLKGVADPYDATSTTRQNRLNTRIAISENLKKK